MTEGARCFTVKIADTVIRIHSRYDRVFQLCQPYLTADKSPAELEIRAEDWQMDPGWLRRMEAGWNGTVPTHAFPSAPATPEETESLVICQNITEAMIHRGCFLMHGAALETAGEGFLISAPSGTGKSTRARLWTEEIPGSVIINGDKPLVQVSATRVLVWGTPWCGKEEWSLNRCVPLKAILLLERAEENALTRVDARTACLELIRQTFRPAEPEAQRTTIRLLRAMIDMVRVYRFRSLPTPEAVRLAYEICREPGREP